MRIAATLLGAVCYALALPPFDWPAFGWIALAPLLWAVRGTSAASAGRLGLLYGYAFGWAATWPFTQAIVRYFDLPFPLAVLAIGAWYLVIVGVPFGAFGAGSVLLLRDSPRAATILVPALYVATEGLRARGFGQPWALLGYTQHGLVPVIQVASWTGVYGVSYLLALASTALVCAADAWRSPRRWTEGALPLGIAASAGVACVLGGLGTLGRTRADTTGTQVALVQAHLPPARRWSRAYTARQIAAHVQATDAIPPSAAPTLIVWPENAVPRYLETDPVLAESLGRLAMRHHADLLFGGPRVDGSQTYNSARLITAMGHNGGAYDKRRLVWFAEQTPHLKRRPPTADESPEEFVAGTGSGVLRSAVPLGVTICHEIVYADLVADEVARGAALLVNIANDGWLDAGTGAARRQHLAMTVFRAVENRRFVLRAATSGPSAIVDPWGRVTGSLEMDRTGVLLGTVTPRAGLTPYARYGDVFAALCTMAALLGLAWSRGLAPVSRGLRVPATATPR